MKINTIKAYLEDQRKARFEAEGMTSADFATELGLSHRAAQQFVKKEVEAGRLKCNGTRSIPACDGRVSRIPVYTLVPYET